MDAGLAAVLGAVAGALATTGAALATGWAMREQAKITARAEHRRQRREPRSDIYKRFIDAARDMEHHTRPGSLIDQPEDDPEVMDHYAVRLGETAYQVREAWIEVALAGPSAVEKIASQIDQCSQ
ncbi:hypothetical protein [Streptomyces cavernae]|uniref:hypothetical protein n=1 Tax=Streptomyces cavernae TaxID=2259034 RepID=UPI000FEBF53B|nr:hypothetical protein [Streptomyces cavernae]